METGNGYLAIGLAVSGIVVLGVFVFLISRRRQAEAHARDLGTVLKNLTKSQQDLRSCETRLRALLENTTDIVWEADKDLVYTYCSPSIESILGYTAEDVVGKSLCDFALAEDRPKIRQAFDSAREGGHFSLLEHGASARDGRRITLESGGRVIADSEGNITGYRGVDRDITARRLLEAEVRQSQKMEAVGRLAGGIAHDFNNALTIISACTSLMEQCPGEDVSRYAKSIKKAVERSAGMTRQLLAFSRRQVLQAKPLDLNCQLGEVQKMLGFLIGEDVEIVMDLAPHLWPVKADPSQFEQVVFNLAVNARDAMPCGGSILIQTSNMRVMAGQVTQDGAPVPAGEYVLLVLSDTGHGMEAATLSRAFEPFFTTKEEGKGTGLGLATVYGIVKQSNGYISVQSEPGAGTTFRILLPRIMGAVNGAESLAGSPHSANATVLLVEDEEPVRLMMAEVLKTYGYKVLVASGGQDALEICQDFPGPIDLLLADVIMPKVSGPQVAEEVTALRPELRVLFMSGYTDDRLGSHGLLDPDVNLIYKPFSPDGLQRALTKVLQGCRPDSNSVPVMAY
jgi:two-component system, cell cycle sensor histidine kinase and response regulator CckA